jgi:hypothetical protein
MYWIVLVNSYQYRIYTYDKQHQQLALLKHQTHPASKLKNADLVSDRSGHYIARDSARGGYQSHHEPKTNETTHFLRDLAHLLHEGLNLHHYQEWVLIAPSVIDGMLSPMLSKHMFAVLKGTIHKDYSHITDKELMAFLHEHWLDIGV